MTKSSPKKKSTITLAGNTAKIAKVLSEITSPVLRKVAKTELRNAAKLPRTKSPEKTTVVRVEVVAETTIRLSYVEFRMLRRIESSFVNRYATLQDQGIIRQLVEYGLVKLENTHPSEKDWDAFREKLRIWLDQLTMATFIPRNDHIQACKDVARLMDDDKPAYPEMEERYVTTDAGYRLLNSYEVRFVLPGIKKQKDKKK